MTTRNILIRIMLCLIAAVSAQRGMAQEGTILNQGVEIIEAKGWNESAYVKWNLCEGATTYHVYVKGGSIGSSYTRIDDALVRDYGTYGRADVVGLAAGTNYALRVVPVVGEQEQLGMASEATGLRVENYNREGFAHFRYTGVGAYRDDGRLKDGARVLYVTKRTAKSVTCDVITSAKGGKTTCKGLQTILDAYQKGYDTTPLAIRVIGKVSLGDLDHISSKAEGLQIKGNSGYNEMNITIEGIGDDATLSGFGLLLRNCRSVELRNFAIMMFMDDAVSLDTNNEHIWVHHLDLFYGQKGSDADQAKGDGSFDLKGGTRYVTASYCRFWDSGKASLCGMGDDEANYITYHHNWFDHSDSRHPRIRCMSVHVWNNYYDGVAKYGVGATTGASAFVEANYFRNIKYPMLISMQGSDIISGKGTFSGEDGGIIKSFGNVFAERSSSFRYVTYQQNQKEFDAWEAASRDDRVPATVKAKQGGSVYDNFDTDPSLMYEYTPEPAADVPATVTGWYGAGRMAHGDFTWDFSGEDKSSEIDETLKEALVGYTSQLVGIFGEDALPGDDSGEGGEGGDGGEGDDSGQVISAALECHFQDKKPSSSFFEVEGNYSDSKGSAKVNGVTYTVCLKLETSTSVTFTTDREMMLTLVFGSNDTKYDIKIDGVKHVGHADNGTSGQGTLTKLLPAGEHVLTKQSTGNLFYISLGVEQPALMGDVNSDGSVDISDVLSTVDYILGRQVGAFDRAAANMNNDNAIDISDVLQIVDVILGRK